MTSDQKSKPSDFRVYTDARFSDVHIVNDGSSKLDVVQVSEGRNVVVESIRTSEKPGSSAISEEFAARRAKAIFDGMADEVLDSLGEAGPGRDFADEQVFNADRVLDLWEKAQAMAEGPEKERLLRMAREAAMHVEGTATEIVNSLLEG